MACELHHAPTIYCRGEFVRLALAADGAPEVDVARGSEDTGQGQRAMHKLPNDKTQTQPPLAPPFLKDGDLLDGQTAAILQDLASAMLQNRRRNGHRRSVGLHVGLLPATCESLLG